MAYPARMPTQAVIDDFLAGKRVAVIGVSRRPQHFGNAIYRELRKKGYEVFAVSPSVDQIEGDRCYHKVSELPEVDGAVVMVGKNAAAAVVEECADAKIPRVWLHQGAGAGAVSDEAVALCHAQGIPVVDGACPMMYAKPVGFLHRAHRFCKRLNGSLPK